MPATTLALPAVLLLTCALTGCGVDSTRALWAHPWMGDPPERHRAVWQSGKVAEYGAKGIITPMAVTVDVLTDQRVWQGVVIVGFIALEVLASSGGGGGGCNDVHFGSENSGDCTPHDHCHEHHHHE